MREANQLVGLTLAELGKNIKPENKDLILSLADELDFEVYIQEDDYENLTFRYVKIRD